MPGASSQEHEVCRECGTPLGEGQGDLCFACAMASADERVSHAQVAAEQDRLPVESRRTRMKQLPTIALLAVCVVCLGVIVWRAPAFVEGLQSDRPIRTGPMTSAGSCDECVQNLWSASAALGERRDPPSDLRCPASGAAYRIEREAGMIVVACPNPEEHKLSSLSVSSERRVPEAVR